MQTMKRMYIIELRIDADPTVHERVAAAAIAVGRQLHQEFKGVVAVYTHDHARGHYDLFVKNRGG